MRFQNYEKLSHIEWIEFAIFLQFSCKICIQFYTFAEKHKKMIHGKLRNLRKEKGMSQKEIAQILSTDISSYSRKENGKSKIHDEEWEKLAKVLDVSVEEIKEEGIGTVHNDNSGNYYDQHFSIPAQYWKICMIT